MKQVGKSVGAATKPVFSKKFVRLGQIYAHWPQIVGSAIADKALPVRITSAAPQNGEKIPRLTLEIRTTSSFATAMEYRKETILHDLNAFIGSPPIHALKIVHYDSDVKNLNSSAMPKPLDQDKLDTLMKHVPADNVLYERLQRISSIILRKSAN